MYVRHAISLSSSATTPNTRTHGQNRTDRPPLPKTAGYYIGVNYFT